MKETKQIARITATIIKLAKFSMGKISVSYSDFVCFKSTWNVYKWIVLSVVAHWFSGKRSLL